MTPLKSYDTYRRKSQLIQQYVYKNSSNISINKPPALELYDKISSSPTDDSIYIKEGNPMLHTHPSIHNLYHINNTILSSDILPQHIKSHTTLSCQHKRQSYWNTKCCCLFSYLPDELMLFNIFTYCTQSELTQLIQTCKRWRCLASDRLLWNNIDLSKYSKKLSDNALTSLLNRYVTVYTVM